MSAADDRVTAIEGEIHVAVLLAPELPPGSSPHRGPAIDDWVRRLGEAVTIGLISRSTAGSVLRAEVGRVEEQA